MRFLITVASLFFASSFLLLAPVEPLPAVDPAKKALEDYTKNERDLNRATQDRDNLQITMEKAKQDLAKAVSEGNTTEAARLDSVIKSFQLNLDSFNARIDTYSKNGVKLQQALQDATRTTTALQASESFVPNTETAKTVDQLLNQKVDLKSASDDTLVAMQSELSRATQALLSDKIKLSDGTVRLKTAIEQENSLMQHDALLEQASKISNEFKNREQKSGPNSYASRFFEELIKSAKNVLTNAYRYVKAQFSGNARLELARFSFEKAQKSLVAQNPAFGRMSVSEINNLYLDLVKRSASLSAVEQRQLNSLQMYQDARLRLMQTFTPYAQEAIARAFSGIAVLPDNSINFGIDANYLAILDSFVKSDGTIIVQKDLYEQFYGEQDPLEALGLVGRDYRTYGVKQLQEKFGSSQNLETQKALAKILNNFEKYRSQREFIEILVTDMFNDAGRAELARFMSSANADFFKNKPVSSSASGAVISGLPNLEKSLALPQTIEAKKGAVKTAITSELDYMKFNTDVTPKTASYNDVSASVKKGAQTYLARLDPKSSEFANEYQKYRALQDVKTSLANPLSDEIIIEYTKAFTDQNLKGDAASLISKARANGKLDAKDLLLYVEAHKPALWDQLFERVFGIRTIYFALDIPFYKGSAASWSSDAAGSGWKDVSFQEIESKFASLDAQSQAELRPLLDNYRANRALLDKQLFDIIQFSFDDIFKEQRVEQLVASINRQLSNGPMPSPDSSVGA